MTTPACETAACAAPCDVLIVGAGPAGMAAALAAAPSGARIVLLDDNPLPGGQIWRDGPGAELPRPARALRERLAGCANVRVLVGTRVVGVGERPVRDEPWELLLEDRHQGWLQRADRLILCTGARELLLPFPGWTLPGVTGAGGLQALIKAGLPVRGERIVVAGSGPLLLAVARTAGQAGGRVLRVAEQAPWSQLVRFALSLGRWPGKALQAPALLHPALRAGMHVVEAFGADRLEAVRLAGPGGTHVLECDRLACGFGLVPNTHLGQMLGCWLNAHEGLAVDALQATVMPRLWAAGECTGVGGSDKALVEGAVAGHAAVAMQAQALALGGARRRWQSFAQAVRQRFALAPGLRGLPRADTIVCRCEDVAYGELATRTGWIDAKLHTRCGMGPCQGRVCGAATRHLFDWTPLPGRHLLSPARVATLATGLDESEETPA